MLRALTFEPNSYTDEMRSTKQSRKILNKMLSLRIADLFEMPFINAWRINICMIVAHSWTTIIPRWTSQ